MRILIDARDVGVNRKGVGRVLEELVPRLVALDQDRYLVVATKAAVPRLKGVGASHLKLVPRLYGTVWEQIGLPLVARALRAQATYSHRECGPIWGPPLLLHVTEDPEVRWQRDGVAGMRDRARRTYSGLFLGRALRRAEVVTSTGATRDDLVRHHSLGQDRVTVVPLGVDTARFKPRRAGTADDGPYLFCLASDDPRENCDLIVKSFARLRERGENRVRLVVAGSLGRQAKVVGDLARSLGIQGAVDLPGRVSDEDLVSLYAGSAATICASEYEGFGLQPLEALACGALLIAVPAVAVKEVVGDGVVLWADLSVDGIAQAMSTALLSPGLRDRAVTVNPAVAAGLDWSQTATRLHGLLEDLASSRGGRATAGGQADRAGSVVPRPPQVR